MVTDRIILGLHQTEYDVTPSTLRHYKEHADASIFSKYLQKRVGTFIPRPLIAKFLDSVRNEVLSRLTLLKLSCSTANAKSPAISRVVALPANQPVEKEGQENQNVLSDEQENFGDMPGAQAQRGIQCFFATAYASQTLALPVENADKSLQLQRKLSEYKHAIYTLVRGEDAPPEDPALEDEVSRRMRNLMLMEADPDNYREIIEQWRPFGNSMAVLKNELRAKCTLDDCFLRKDIYLRLSELNRVAYARLDRHFFDESGIVPEKNMAAYLRAKRQLMEALAVECWYEFFHNENVSRPCLAIRKFLTHYERPQALAKTRYVRRRIGKRMPTYAMQKELRPYAEYLLYVQGFMVAQGDLTHNFKIIRNLYFGKSQHCRWFYKCNNPKVNFGMEGNGMSGKSHAMHVTMDTMPPGVPDNITYITPKAFCTETNMNNLFICYEEMEMKYLGVGEADSDTTNFFKARLTNGETSVMAWYKDPETGKTSMMQTRNHVQGSMMFASNFDFSKVSPNILSRVTLMSVPKTKHDFHGIRTQDKYKPQYALDDPATREMFDQQQELHAVLYVVEMMVKSCVFGDHTCGVNMDGARIIANAVLDRLQDKYGVNTNDPRKRNHVMEMIRSRCLNHAVYIGRTSSVTAHTHFHPFTKEYYGFSPRVILDGILPFMCATKDHIIDGLASMYFQYVHEHEDKILEAFVKRSRVLEHLREDAFLKRYSNGVDPSVDTNQQSGGGLNRSGGFTRASMRGGQQNYETDYNFITVTGRSYREIETVLSNTLEEFVVSANDISKLLKDLTKVYDDVGTYELKYIKPPLDAANEEAAPVAGDAEDDEQEELDLFGNAVIRATVSGDKRTTPDQRRIVHNPFAERDNRQVVEYTRCAATGKYAIAFSLQFLKKKLPHLLKDDLVDDSEKTLEQTFSEMRLQDDDVSTIIVEEQQPEEMDEATRREEMIRKMGYMTSGGEKLIYRAIEDVLQNNVLENMVPEELRESHRHPVRGTVPWESFITPDHPRTRRMAEISPELDERSRNERGKKGPDMLFVDKLMMLNLKRKENGQPFVIDNYNRCHPRCAALYLSIIRSRRPAPLPRRKNRWRLRV